MGIHFLLAFVILAWLVGVALSAVALALAILAPARRFHLIPILAGFGMIVGYLGFGHWTPFSLFPQIGYTWSSGDFQISLASSWFFLVPLIVGVVALLVAIAK
jgi:hypothetical protein